MDTRLLLTATGAFLVIVLFAIGVLLIMREHAKKRVRNRLSDIIMNGEDSDDRASSIILRDLEVSTVPFLNTLLKNARWAQRLDTLLVQADINVRLSTFIIIMVSVALFSSLVTIFVFGKPIFALPVGLAFGSVPLFYARQKKRKRINKFERQFPDALDMLTNALRAGMALAGAIQVVADESPDPVASEFAILFEENRLGLDMKVALQKLAGRVDSAELRLFVTAVILQRETGGNLAEILQGTAAVIRDRFRILGDVRSMTAQARLSGFVLIFLPLGLAAFIIVIAPDYLKELFNDPIGRYLIGFAGMLQIVGYLIMRRIVDIKV